MTKEINTGKLKIVLLLDNKDRELRSLLLVKKALEKTLRAKVYIIGSLAEHQRILYLLSSIQPQLVIISQIFEKNCREIAQYIKKSGGILAVLPCEVRTSPAYQLLVKNEVLTYREYLDYIFLPGKSLAKLFSKTDIPISKIHIVGSPKIDAIMQKRGANFMSKIEFLRTYNLPINRENIFIFTSFVKTDQAYLQQDILFKNQMKYKKYFNKVVDSAKAQYTQALLQLATDFPNTNLIIKPHPLEKNSYDELLKMAKNNNIFIVTAPLDNCLKSIDLAVHWVSTVALECWLHNIKVIEFFPNKQNKELLPDFAKGNPIAFDYTDLKKFIDRYQKENLPSSMRSFQHTYLVENYYLLDGNSSQRIAKILLKCLKIPEVKYQQRPYIQIKIVLLLEKLIGVKLSRKLLKVVARDYHSKYAIDNFLYLE